MNIAHDLQSIPVQQRTRAVAPFDADRAWQPGTLPPVVEAGCAQPAHACGARALAKV
jgi:hypothetical protein